MLEGSGEATLYTHVYRILRIHAISYLLGVFLIYRSFRLITFCIFVVAVITQGNALQAWNVNVLGGKSI